MNCNETFVKRFKNVTKSSYTSPFSWAPSYRTVCRGSSVQKMVALRGCVLLLSATLIATVAQSRASLLNSSEDGNPGETAAASRPTAGVRPAALGDPRLDLECFERGDVARQDHAPFHDDYRGDGIDARCRSRKEGPGGSTNFLPPRVRLSTDWGCSAHFRTNLNPQRWVSVPHCARRVAPGDQYYFLQDVATCFKCTWHAVNILAAVALMMLASRKLWNLTKVLQARTLCIVGPYSDMSNVGLVMLIPTRRHWKIFVLTLLLSQTSFAMNLSAQPPIGAAGLTTAAAAVGIATGASATAGIKRARENAAANLPADGNASKFMSALGAVLRDQRGGIVDATPVKTSEVCSVAKIPPSSSQNLLNPDRNESLVKAGLVAKAGYGKVQLTPAGVEWLNPPVSSAPAIMMNISCPADAAVASPENDESDSNDGDSGASAACPLGCQCSQHRSRGWRSVGSSLAQARKAVKSAEASAASARQKAALKASLGCSTSTSHDARSMQLNPRDCFDLGDESEWLLPSSSRVVDMGSSDSASSSSDAESYDDGSSDSGSAAESASDSGSASDHAPTSGALSGSDANDDGLQVSWSSFHRYANNTIARMAVYCGYEGGREDETGEPLPPKKASVGKLRQLLTQCHERLPREAIPPADGKDGEVEREVFANVKSALGMLKAKIGFNRKGARGTQQCFEADRHAYHTILTAALPPKAEGDKKSRFRRVCAALGVSARKGKQKGKARPIAAAQQSHERRTFLNRTFEGDFKVGDWVTCRGAGKDRALYTTEVSSPRSLSHIAPSFEITKFAFGCWQIAAVDLSTQTLTLEILGGNGTFPDVPFSYVSGSWVPKRRPPPWNSLSDETKQKVIEWIETETWASPCKKDIIRLWRRNKVFARHPVHYYYGTKREMWGKFKAANATVKVSLASFKRLVPWYVRKGGRESCLCGCCENMRLLLKALNDAQEHLHDALMDTMDESGAPCCTDVSDDNDGTPRIPTSHARLCSIAAETSKSTLVAAMLCDGAISEGKCACVDGGCDQCGFKQLWSLGLRPRIVDDTVIPPTSRGGKPHTESSLKPDASTKWGRMIKYSEHKAERDVGPDASHLPVPVPVPVVMRPLCDQRRATRRQRRLRLRMKMMRPMARVMRIRAPVMGTA